MTVMNVSIASELLVATAQSDLAERHAAMRTRRTVRELRTAGTGRTRRGTGRRSDAR